MPKIEFTANAAAPAGPYSQAVSFGGLAAISGQVGIDPIDGSVPEAFEFQARNVFANLRAVLAHLGAGPEDVVKTTCFLADVALMPDFNRVYVDFFGEHRPARSTIGVTLGGGFLVEVEAWTLVARRSHQPKSV